MTEIAFIAGIKDGMISFPYTRSKIKFDLQLTIHVNKMRWTKMRKLNFKFFERNMIKQLDDLQEEEDLNKILTSILKEIVNKFNDMKV